MTTETITDSSRLAKILRVLGCLSLLGTASTFLLLQWPALTQTSRFLTLSSFTIMLGVLTFITHERMQALTTAKTVAHACLAFIILNFAQLGALIYSSFPGTARINYPKAFLWQAPSLSFALTLATVGILVLVPVAVQCIKSIFKEERLSIGGWFLLLGFVFLLPVRDATVIGLLVAALIVGSSALVVECQRHQALDATLVCLIPIAVLMGRSIVLYHPTELSIGLVSLAISASMFVPLAVAAQTQKSRESLQLSSLPFLWLGWSLTGHQLFQEMEISMDYFPAALFLPLALVNLAQAYVASSGRSFFANLAALMAIGGGSIQLLWYRDIFSSIVALVIAAGLVVAGTMTRSRLIVTSGTMGFVFSLLMHLSFAERLFSQSPWLSLGIVGTLILLGAAYAEQNGEKIERFITLLIKGSPQEQPK